jgi:hypothetical protein
LLIARGGSRDAAAAAAAAAAAWKHGFFVTNERTSRNSPRHTEKTKEKETDREKIASIIGHELITDRIEGHNEKQPSPLNHRLLQSITSPSNKNKRHLFAAKFFYHIYIYLSIYLPIFMHLVFFLSFFLFSILLIFPQLFLSIFFYIGFAALFIVRILSISDEICYVLTIKNNILIIQRL